MLSIQRQEREKVNKLDMGNGMIGDRVTSPMRVASRDILYDTMFAVSKHGRFDPQRETTPRGMGKTETQRCGTSLLTRRDYGFSC